MPALGRRWCLAKSGSQMGRTPQAKSRRCPIWRNLAVVRGYIAEYRGSADAWRRYAELDVEADDEIEAEATAQLLRRDEAEGFVEDLEVQVSLRDFEQFEQRIVNHPRTERLTVDMNQYNDQGQPPPRAIYAIFNKPLPKDSTALKAADVPVILGNVFCLAKRLTASHVWRLMPIAPTCPK